MATVLWSQLAASNYNMRHFTHKVDTLWRIGPTGVFVYKYVLDRTYEISLIIE